MKKKIKEFNNYELNNPFIEKATFKEIFMTNAYKVYKYLRLKVSPVHPLENWQELKWRDEELEIERDNSAICTDDKCKAFFNIETIVVSEILPKEVINKLHLCLEKMQFAHQDKKAINMAFRKSNVWESFQNYRGFGSLGNFKINESSKLFPYASRLQFSIHSLSDSFCRLDIKIYPN
ncbi:MAG: hypothetical protein R3Y35_09205 [Clostridia bacterium]